MPNGPMPITSGPSEPDLYKSEMEVQDAELKALLQSSASRKTQKKKKKKASKTAENATSGETLEENEAGDWGGSPPPACRSCLIPTHHTPGSEVQFDFSTQDREQSGVSLSPSPPPVPAPVQQQPATADSGLGRPGFPATEDYFK